MKKLLTLLFAVICLLGVSSCNYDFDDKVKGISLNKTTLELRRGEQETLSATIKPTYAFDKRIKWKSENPLTASVKDGLVTAISSGTTQISVTTLEGGFVATCTIVVTE